MYLLPDCEKIDWIEDYIVTGKSFGENGEGHIMHKFPANSEPEEKRLAYERVFATLYQAAVNNNNKSL